MFVSEKLHMWHKLKNLEIFVMEIKQRPETV